MAANPILDLTRWRRPPSPIPGNDDEGGHTQPGMVTLCFVFLVLNNDFVIFYSRV